MFSGCLELPLQLTRGPLCFGATSCVLDRYNLLLQKQHTQVVNVSMQFCDALSTAFVVPRISRMHLSITLETASKQVWVMFASCMLCKCKLSVRDLSTVPLHRSQCFLSFTSSTLCLPCDLCTLLSADHQFFLCTAQHSTAAAALQSLAIPCHGGEDLPSANNGQATDQTA